MSDPSIRVVAESPVASEPVLEAIKVHLRAFNRNANPAYYALRDAPENAPRPLHVVAYGPDGAVVGGLIGETCLTWCDIEILAVREGERGRGVGTRLMRAAEVEAVARGCRWAAVDTADFQAPEFYRKLGYSLVGKVEDRDGFGNAKHYFTRRIG